MSHVTCEIVGIGTLTSLPFIALIMGSIPDTYRHVRFNGTFDQSSNFKGPPSPTTDKAWNSLTHCREIYFETLGSADMTNSRCYEHHRRSFPATQYLKACGESASRNGWRSFGFV